MYFWNSSVAYKLIISCNSLLAKNNNLYINYFFCVFSDLKVNVEKKNPVLNDLAQQPASTNLLGD